MVSHDSVSQLCNKMSESKKSEVCIKVKIMKHKSVQIVRKKKS